MIHIDYYDLDGKRHRVDRVAPVSTERKEKRIERDILARLAAGSFARWIFGAPRKACATLETRRQ